MLLHHELLTATDSSLSTIGWMISAAATWIVIGIDALRRKWQLRRRQEG